MGIIPARKPKEVRHVLAILNKEWVYFLRLYDIAQDIKECAETGGKRQKAIKDYKKLKYGGLLERAKNLFRELKRFESREQFIAPVSRLRGAMSDMFKLPIFEPHGKRRAKELVQQLNVFEAGLLFDTVKKLGPELEQKEAVVSDYPVVRKEAIIDWEKVKNLAEKIIERLQALVAIEKELREIIEHTFKGRKNEEQRLKEEAWDLEEEAKRQQKRRVKAILDDFLNHAQQRVKHDLSSAYRKIAKEVSTENPDKAIDYLSKAIRLSPYDDSSYAKRGLVFFYKKDIEKAIRDFSQAIRLSGRWNAEAFEYRGQCWILKGHYYRAIVDFTYAIRNNPRLGGAYIDLAFCYGNIAYSVLAKENFDRSIEFFGYAISTYWDYLSKIPEQERIDIKYSLSNDYFHRGTAYSRKGSKMLHGNEFHEAIRFFDNAIYHFGEALQLNPGLGDSISTSMVSAYINRGLAKHSIGLNKEAVADFDSAIRLDPNNNLAKKLKQFVLEGGHRIG